MPDRQQKLATFRWLWNRCRRAERLRLLGWLLRRAVSPGRVVRAVKQRIGFGRRRENIEEVEPTFPEDVTIETSRLILREFHPGDLHELALLIGSPAVGKEERKPSWRDGYTLVKEITETYLTWTVRLRSTGAAVGYIGLSRLELDGQLEHELGYRVGSRYEGPGFASEAAAAAREFALGRTQLTRVVSVIEPSNVASVRVALKNGMRHEKDTTFGGVPVGVYVARHGGPCAPGPGEAGT